MRLHSARCAALLLAATFATAGVAVGQQYPYVNFSQAEGSGDVTEAPPPPTAEAAPNAIAPSPTAPGMAQPGTMAQPGMVQQGGAPGIYAPVGDGYVGNGYYGDGQCGPDDVCGCTNQGDCCGRHGCHGCDDCCLGCCQPHYVYVRADTLFMTRSAPRSQPLTSVGPGGGAIALTTATPGFRWQPVERILIGFPICDDTAVELTYMGLQTWTSQAVVNSAAGNLFSAYSNFGNPTAFNEFDGSNQQTTFSNSRLHTAEGNFVTCLPVTHRENHHLNMLHGVRWIEVNERFTYNTVRTLAPSGASFTTITTFNELVGYQLGLRWESDITCRLHLMLESKAGIYANMSSQRTQISSSAVAGGGLPVEAATRNDVAFASEAIGALTYDCCSWLSLRLGYSLLFVNGLALAPENFVSQPTPGRGAVPRSPAIVNNHGGILYHGGSVGLEVRF